MTTSSLNCIVSLSIGPVQDFIAAALRTRDLWFGSTLLSEISKTAARSMRDQKADLIFPTVTKPSDLDENSPFNVPNHLIAIVDGDLDAGKDVLNAAKASAKARLTDLIVDGIEAYDAKIPDCRLRTDIVQQQNDPTDLLELYGTCVMVDTDNKNPYLDARTRLDKLTGARKQTRDFTTTSIDPNGLGFGLPKSSLDGRRETVLAEFPSDKNQTYRHRLRMSAGEQLDLLGLVKRLSGDAQQFTPTTRIAIDPWIRRVVRDEKGRELLKPVHAVLDSLVASDLVTRVSGNRDASGQSIYHDMPYDSGILYAHRLDATIRDCRQVEIEKDIIDQLTGLRKNLQPLWKDYGHPSPYYVMLRADGDFMGRLIHAAPTKNAHQTISTQLSLFSQSVSAICRIHRSHCIYAGGDDVLALVPVDQVLAVTDALRTEFYDQLKTIAATLNVKTPPTLSAGVVLTHMQEPVGRVRRLAITAEHLAKGNGLPNGVTRNALGIVVSPRSGADLQLRIRWDDDPKAQLSDLIALFNSDDLPARFAYELRTLDAFVDGLSTDEAARIVPLELRRILKRKRQTRTTDALDQRTRDTIHTLSEKLGFSDLYNHLLIARWLSVRA